LDERNFWGTVKKDAGKVAGVVGPIASFASNFIREEPEFEAREFNEFDARKLVPSFPSTLEFHS